MSWDDADSYLEKQIGELKSLTIGVSRGLRDLTRAEPRGRAEPERDRAIHPDVMEESQ